MKYKKDNTTGLKPNQIETLDDRVFAIVMTLSATELSSFKTK